MAKSISSSPRVKFKRVHRSLRFRSGRDIMDVAPNDCPNITELLEKDAIQDRSVPALFNQIEGIADIGARVRDRFDILNYQNSMVRIRGARKESDPDDDK